MEQRVYSLNDFEHYFGNRKNDANCLIGLRLISAYVPIYKMNEQELSKFKYDFSRLCHFAYMDTTRNKIFLKINKRAMKLKIKIKPWWQMNLKES